MTTMGGVCWACAVSSMAGLLLYANSLDCGLCFDDEAAIRTNSDLRANSSWHNLLWDDFWGMDISDPDSHKSYRPLCVATFRLNYLWHGLAPMGYHVVNVGLHAVVCYLYVQLCVLIFKNVWPALLTGLLFAAHPIHTEAVSGLVGRADILAGLFCLAAMLTYFPPPSGWGANVVVTMVMCLASALSKELGVASFVLSPLFLCLIRKKVTVQRGMSLLLGRHGQARPEWWRSVFLSTCLLAGVCVMFLVGRILLNQGAPVFSVHDNPALVMMTPYRQLHWSYLIYYNVHLLLFPSSLSAEVSLSTIAPVSSLSDPRNLLTLLTFASVCLLFFRSLRTNDQTVLCGLVLLVVPFLPASNLFFPVGFVVAERVLYLPSMGFCLLVGVGSYRLHRRYPMLIKLMLGYLLLAHGVKTVMRNRAWFSNYDLFRTAVVTSRSNAKMINNLATEVDKTLGNRTLAVELLQLAVETEPHFITAYINLGYNLRQLGRMDHALKVYQAGADLVTRGLTKKDVHITPKSVKVFNSLSNMLREHAHDPQGALKYASRAIEVEPGWENGYHSKANALMELGQWGEARVAFEKALELNPDFSLAQSNYGNCLTKLGLVEEAEAHLQKALELDEDHTLTKFRTAAVIVKLPGPSRTKLEQAEKLLLDVLGKEPNNGNATFNLALVYFDLGRHEDAELYYKKALSISPTDRGSLLNLGVLLTQLQRFSEAIEYLTLLLHHYPDHPSGNSQLATCFMQTNQTDLARQQFQKALVKNSEDLMALNNYAFLCMTEGQTEVALQLFSRLLDLDPSNTPVRRQVEILKQKVQKKMNSPQ